MTFGWRPFRSQPWSRWLAAAVALLLTMLDRYGEQFALLEEDDAEAHPWPTWIDEG